MSPAQSRDTRSTGTARGVQETLPSKVIRPRFVPDEFFGHQPTPSSALPDPAPLIENLTRCVIEILAGARELEQISRWVTDDVYRHLLKTVAQIGIRRSRFSLVGSSTPHRSGPRLRG